MESATRPFIFMGNRLLRIKCNPIQARAGWDRPGKKVPLAPKNVNLSRWLSGRTVFQADRGGLGQEPWYGSW